MIMKNRVETKDQAAVVCGEASVASIYDKLLEINSSVSGVLEGISFSCLLHYRSSMSLAFKNNMDQMSFWVMGDLSLILYHEMFSTENDPEGEQHGVEDALSDVSEKQHPGPVETNGEPLHRDVDECHGDTQS